MRNNGPIGFTAEEIGYLIFGLGVCSNNTPAGAGTNVTRECTEIARTLTSALRNGARDGGSTFEVANITPDQINRLSWTVANVHKYVSMEAWPQFATGLQNVAGVLHRYETTQAAGAGVNTS